MSLDWYTDKIERRDELFEGSPDHVTQGLIWSTLVTGVPSIKKRNVHEVWLRLFILHTTGLWSMEVDGEDYLPSVEEVERRVGLSTNSDLIKSRVKWVVEVVLRRLEDKARSSLRKQGFTGGEI